MNGPVTPKMLYALFENKATQNEKLAIREWLQNTENEEEFYYHLSIWEKEHMQFQPDMQAAESKFDAFLTTGEPSFRAGRPDVLETNLTKGNWRNRFAVAASIVLLLSVATYFIQDYLRYSRYSTEYGMTRYIVLDDGTQVTLNANSTLKVPVDLATNDSRNVWLDGEAFFEVTKRPQKVRFIVHTENIDVEVLGTKFNVNTRRGNTEVVLDEGRVKLTSTATDSDPVIMSPGDYVALGKSDTAFTKRVVEPIKYKAWQSNLMIFEDTPLVEVAQKIEDHYGVSVRIENAALKERLLTGTLPNNDLGVVLKSLTSSHSIRIQYDNDLIIFQ